MSALDSPDLTPGARAWSASAGTDGGSGESSAPATVPIPAFPTATVARFWKYVDRVGVDSCWLWVGHKDSKGYGNFRVESDGRRQYYRAHRVAYALLVGPPPAGLVTDHLCRVRHCVNPEHLEFVTSAENTRRGVRRQTQLPRATHCARGHEFTEANTEVRSTTGRRRCRTCRAIYEATPEAKSAKKIRNARRGRAGQDVA